MTMKTSRLSTDALLLFYDVVNAGSINKAAALLGLPKSSISRRLTELESKLGSNLVKRGAQGLLLTDAGKLLYEHCGRIANEVEEASLIGRDARGELVGSLRVSLPPDFWMSWFGQAISDFAKQHPAIQLELLCHEQPADVSSAPFDLAVHIGRGVRNPNVNVKHLGELGRGFYASPEYLRQRGVPMTLEALQAHALIMTVGQLNEDVWGVPDADGIRKATARFLTNSIGFARELALHDQGIAVLPNLLVAPDLREEHLVRVLGSTALRALTVSGSFMGRKHLARKIRVFLDFVAARLVDEAH
jgi:DNA-binding transcriptional LysR family regulator